MSKRFTFNMLPNNLEEFKALPGADLKDPYAVVALTVIAFDAYGKDRETGIEMLNYLKGPAPLSGMDLSFINDRFMDGKAYIPMSYFEGSSVENDYKPSIPYTIEVSEQAHSDDQLSEGYKKLFIKSSGADSARAVQLRTKASTGEWFLWEFSSVMMSIRIPKSQDAWA